METTSLTCSQTPEINHNTANNKPNIAWNRTCILSGSVLDLLALCKTIRRYFHTHTHTHKCLKVGPLPYQLSSGIRDISESASQLSQCLQCQGLIVSVSVRCY